MTSQALKLNSLMPSLSSSAPARQRAGQRAGQRNGSFIAAFSALAVVLLVAALGFYVYMINAYASKGYELKKQQAVMKELTDTQKRLVVEQAALGSIVKVNDIAATSGMVPVTGEEFLVANQLSSAQ